MIENIKISKKNINDFKDNYDSLSNGFLMRKSPFIAWLYYRFSDDIDKAFNIMVKEIYQKFSSDTGGDDQLDSNAKAEDIKLEKNKKDNIEEQIKQFMQEIEELEDNLNELKRISSEEKDKNKFDKTRYI